MRCLVCIMMFLGSAIVSAQVGIETTTPLSTLDINGNLSLKHVALTGSGTATLIDDGIYISISPTANDQDFQLPDPRTYPGRVYIIRNVTNTINADITLAAAVVTAGVGFFAGDSTNSTTQVNMDTSNGGGNTTKTLIFISDGANWTYGQFGF